MITETVADIPVFAIDPANIVLLNSPSDFRSELNNRIKSARHRIVLATLYIGTSETSLIDELHAALSRNPTMQLIVLIDRFRGTRKDKAGNSTASILHKLATQFPRQVQVSLYRSPAANTPWLHVLPQRFNEVFGVQHIKAYVFDNDVVIGGANLSTDYFTNRQDRYMLVRNTPGLSDYFTDLVKTVSGLSNRLVGCGSRSAIRRTKASLDALNRLWMSRTMDTRRQLVAAEAAASSSPCTSDATVMDTTPCTFVAPAIQLGIAGIRLDEQATLRAMDIAATNPHTNITLASGYLNLPKPYADALAKARSDVRVICSSPEANGFFNSRGVSRYIPHAYSYLELLFTRDFTQNSTSPPLHLLEYARQGWTWHAKGIWIGNTPYQKSQQSRDRHDASVLMAVGSSNLNHRSLHRDMEAQVFVLTWNPQLQYRLWQNLDYLCKHTTAVSVSDLERRRVPLLVRTCARILRSMF